VGHADIAYTKRSGVCPETQHFPGFLNHPAFPATTLKAGAGYESTIVSCSQYSVAFGLHSRMR
jgi:aldose 1-epimerase